MKQEMEARSNASEATHVADKQELIALLNAQAAAIKVLTESDAVRCGRSCYAGEFMSKACGEESAIECK